MKYLMLESQYFKCVDRERMRKSARPESRRMVRGGAHLHEITLEQGAESESE